MQEIYPSQDQKLSHISTGGESNDQSSQYEQQSNPCQVNQHSSNKTIQNGMPNNSQSQFEAKNKSYDRLSTIKNLQRVNQPGLNSLKMPGSLIKQVAIDQKLNKKINRNEPYEMQNKQIKLRTEPNEKDDMAETQKIEKFMKIKQNPQNRLGQHQQQQQQQQFYIRQGDFQKTQKVPRSYSQAKLNERYHTQPNETQESENQETFYLTERSLSRKKFNNNTNSTINHNTPSRNRIYSSADYRTTYNSGFYRNKSGLRQEEEYPSPEKGQTKYTKVIQFFIDKYNNEMEEKKLIEERIQDLKKKIVLENQKHKAAMFEASIHNDNNLMEISQKERLQTQLIDIHRKKQSEQEKIENYELMIKQLYHQNQQILEEVEKEKSFLKEAEQSCKVLKRRSDSQFVKFFGIKQFIENPYFTKSKKQKVHVKKQRNFSLKQVSHREFRVKTLTNSTSVFQKDLQEIMQKYE